MKINFDFNTSYNQFYIIDGMNPHIPKNLWTSEAYYDRLVLADGLVGVLTQSYGHIKGEFELFETENELSDLDSYDHIVEGGLEVTIGTIQFLNCPACEVKLSFTLKPNKYRIRILSKNLKCTDLDEVEGNDNYTVQFWPDNNLKKIVVKNFANNVFI